MSSTQDPGSNQQPDPSERTASQPPQNQSPPSQPQNQPPPQTGYAPQPPAPGQPPSYGVVAAPVVVCQNCGTQVAANTPACWTCQAPIAMVMAPTKDKLVAGLLAIFIGGLGIHKFYLGYNTAGGIMLGLTLSGVCLSVIFIGMLWVWIPGVIALVEGIIYLTKSDYAFQQTYVLNKREWF